MKTKLMTLQDATGFFRDGMTIMVGGFMGIGTPSRLVEALLESGVRDLTLIANDTAFVDTGIGPLIVNGRVRKVIASHIGTNPETGRRMISGEMDVVLVPQGTLIEQIRCGGAGLGGFLTPTGVGTVVEEGKQTLTLDGKTWLLERPLRAALMAALGLTDLSTGAVCVYHEMIQPAVKVIQGRLPIAAVSTGFPAGLTSMETKLREIELSVAAGASLNRRARSGSQCPPAAGSAG